MCFSLSGWKLFDRILCSWIFIGYLCKKFGFLNIFKKEVDDSCWSGFGFKTSIRNSQYSLNRPDFANKDASQYVSSKFCTSLGREQVSTGPWERRAVVSTAICIRSCCFCEPAGALYFWDNFVINWNRLQFLSRAKDKVFFTQGWIVATEEINRKRNRMSQLHEDTILDSNLYQFNIKRVKYLLVLEQQNVSLVVFSQTIFFQSVCTFCDALRM